MPESFLGEGLVYEETLPVGWTEAPLTDPHALLRINGDNLQLLSAEASLDEVRVAEGLKDESPALMHELQRLEYKLNILLRLVAEIAVRNAGIPGAERVRLSSHAMEWFGGRAPRLGSTGIVSIYVNPALPQPVKIPAKVAGERIHDGQHVAQLKFSGLSDAITQMLDKLIFRHHRRLVAGSRGAHFDLDSTLRPTKIR
jgi:hypothetical protein